MLQHARLGLVVGKKTAKSSVRRNYIRRVLREFFRLNQHEICHVDLVIRVQKQFEKKAFGQLRLEFDTLIAKINQRMQLELKPDSQSNVALIALPNE